MNHKEFVGILPVAGKATRLAPFSYPKELLPVTYEVKEGELGKLYPRLVIDYSLKAIIKAGIRRCYIVVSPWKQEVMKYFSNGQHYDIDIAYLYQSEANGLPFALNLAYSWLRDYHTVFLMPDTIIMPTSCCDSLCKLYIETDADLALGVFPTNEAQRLGPVIFDGNRVTAVLDKPNNPPVQNTWGVAIWGRKFYDLLHESVAMSNREDGEFVLGNCFDTAIQRGMKVVANYYDDGQYNDIGTPSGIYRTFSNISHSKVGL